MGKARLHKEEVEKEDEELQWGKQPHGGGETCCSPESREHRLQDVGLNGETHNQRAHPNAGGETERGWQRGGGQKSQEKVREESAAQPQDMKGEKKKEKGDEDKRDFEKVKQE